MQEAYMVVGALVAAFVVGFSVSECLRSCGHKGWLRSLVKTNRPTIVKLDDGDESLDLFVISDQELVRRIPFEVYVELTRDERQETF